MQSFASLKFFQVLFQSSVCVVRIKLCRTVSSKSLSPSGAENHLPDFYQWSFVSWTTQSLCWLYFSSGHGSHSANTHHIPGSLNSHATREILVQSVLWGCWTQSSCEDWDDLRVKHAPSFMWYHLLSKQMQQTDGRKHLISLFSVCELTYNDCTIHKNHGGLLCE